MNSQYVNLHRLNDMYMNRANHVTEAVQRKEEGGIRDERIEEGKHVRDGETGEVSLLKENVTRPVEVQLTRRDGSKYTHVSGIRSYILKQHLGILSFE